MIHVKKGVKDADMKKILVTIPQNVDCTFLPENI